MKKIADGENSEALKTLARSQLKIFTMLAALAGKLNAAESAELIADCTAQRKVLREMLGEVKP